MEGTRYELIETTGHARSYIPGLYRKMLCLLGVLGIAGPAWSLGLGNLEVNSNLDEPLDVRIELISGTADELETAEAALASTEEFALIGLRRPDYLNEIEFTIVPSTESDGATSFAGSYLRLTSDQTMKEPFMHFLVRLNWSGGRLLREYTALIDPPIYAAEVPTQVSTPRIVDGIASEGPAVSDAAPIDPVVVDSIPVGAAAGETVPATQGAAAPEITEDIQTDTSAAHPEEGSAVQASPDGAFATYGPTVDGDTLSGIATQFSAQFPDVDIYQVMYVLVRENPEAFIDGNMNLLMKGQILRLSNLDNVRAVALEDARTEFRVHLSQWSGYADVAAGSDTSVQVPSDSFGDDAGASDGFQDDMLQGEESVSLDAAGDFPATGTDMAQDSGASPGADEMAGGGEQFRIGSAGSIEGGVNGQDADAADANMEVLTLQGQVTELESALFSSDLENEDLRQRVALLEDQLADVNRLIALGDADLAALQSTVAEGADESAGLMTQVGQSGEELGEGGESLAVAEETLADTAQDIDTAVGTVQSETGNQLAESETATDSAPDEATAAASTAVVSQTATMNSRSWWSRLLESLQGVSSLVMALVGLFVVGLAGLIYLRRKRALEEFEHSMLSIGIDSITGPTQAATEQVSGDVEQIEVVDEESDTTRESSFLTVYSDSEVVVHADEVDPIAEADVYLAYGRDQQAEEVLIDGMSKFPDRDDIKLKLLTIYRKRKDVSAFETLAEELYPTETSTSQDTWDLVARMGRKLSPDNPLFSDTPPEPGDLRGTGDEDGDDASTLKPEAEEPAAGSDTGMLEFDKDSDDGTEDDAGNDVSVDKQVAEIEQGGDLPDELEFDLQDEMERARAGENDIELDAVADEVSAVMNSLDIDESEAAAEDAEYELSLEDTEAADPAGSEKSSDQARPLELELEDEIGAAESDAAEEDKHPDGPVGLSSERSEVIEFTPELTARREQMSGRRQSGDSDDSGVEDGSAEKNEFETQIELAKVFIELGDKDGARKILAEVISDGGSTHRRVAEELMSAINE